MHISSMLLYSEITAKNYIANAFLKNAILTGSHREVPAEVGIKSCMYIASYMLENNFIY